MDVLRDTSSGKSVKVEFTLLEAIVRSMRNGKEVGSDIFIVYCLLTDTVPPPAVVPVAVTVKFCVPITLVDPLISPVDAFTNVNPEGRPVAEKLPLPECGIM